MGPGTSRSSPINRRTKIILAILLIVLIIISFFVFRKATQTEKIFIQLNFIALLLGLIFEFIRISGKWSLVLWTAIGSYAFSFVAFFPGKNEKEYVFENHLENWPYVFLGAFIIVAMYSQYAKLTQKLNEGITLLLTIAINYWIIANDYWTTGSTFVKLFIIANALLSLLTLFNAFTYGKLSKGMRLTLSLWSSIITLILSIDNFLKLFRYRNIENLTNLSEAVFVFFQFFLLGVSSIYIAQNATMILDYMPHKGYRDKIRKANEVHLSRFSKEQIIISDLVLAIIFSLIGFTANYFFQFFPTNFMIWAMIAIAPAILYINHMYFNKIPQPQHFLKKNRPAQVGEDE